MDPAIIGALFLVVMVTLIALGIPIAIVLAGTGALGFFVIASPIHAETQLVLNFWERGTSFVLTAGPLYLLMGQLVFRTRIAEDLYDCIYKWLGWLPGGLAIASVVA